MAAASRNPAGAGPRSSLRSHTFPSFYACYLLKSIQTPQSKATYIGSTPSPPRRIRQHNGEITQGAWKTKQKRPWVMQMIVHGFPSKLSALQFEWAWQHPHLSRHLRDQAGKALFTGDRKSKYLKVNIQIVHIMLSTHPYNTWPLHIKLFTEEAVKHWKEASKGTKSLPLPLGFTCSIELEGVDGKSGHVGSGRQGPINVEDEQFTSTYLAKNSVLMASTQQLKCSICEELLVDYAANTLITTLCPAPACTAVSHLICLSKHFLASQTAEMGLMPRGGRCKSCCTYVLWGDVIRGCYRRNAGGALCEPEDDAQDDKRDEFFELDIDHRVSDHTAPVRQEKITKRKVEDVKPKSGKPRQKKSVAVIVANASSEGEHSDFDVSSTDETNGFPGLSPHLPRRKRGRPQETSPLKDHGLSAGLSSQHIRRVAASGRPKPIKRNYSNHPHVTSGQPENSSNESGEYFDFGGLSEDGEDDAGPPQFSSSCHIKTATEPALLRKQGF